MIDLYEDFVASFETFSDKKQSKKDVYVHKTSGVGIYKEVLISGI